MSNRGKKYMQQQATEKKLSGIHIYIDDHQRTVYYDVFSKTGYVLDNNEKTYGPYALRFFLGIFGGILASLFEMPLYLCVIAGIVVYGVMEFKFRKFLKKLPLVPEFVPKKRIGIVSSASNETSTKILLKILLYAALSVLILMNAYMEKYDGFMLAANWLIALFGGYFTIINLLGLARQLKNGTFELKK